MIEFDKPYKSLFWLSNSNSTGSIYPRKVSARIGFLNFLFPNSGTLKGSSRVFKESQGVPPSLVRPCRPAVLDPIFRLKTNTF